MRRNLLNQLTTFESHVGLALRTTEDYKTILTTLNETSKRIAAKQKVTLSRILSPGLKAGSIAGITAFLMSIIILQTWENKDPSSENQDMGIVLDWISNLPYYNYNFVKLMMDELSIAASDIGIVLGFLLMTLGNMVRLSCIRGKTCISGRDKNGYTALDGDDEENQLLLSENNIPALIAELEEFEDNLDGYSLNNADYQEILTKLDNISKQITAKANNHKIIITKTLTRVWEVLTPGFKAGTSFGIAALIASFVALKIWGKENPSSENNNMGIVLDWMVSLQYYNFNFIKIIMDDLAMAAFASGNIAGFSITTVGNVVRLGLMKCKTCICNRDNNSNSYIESNDEDRESFHDDSDQKYFGQDS